jgi:hypothetical protein
MDHLISIKFEGTGYTPRLYACTHDARTVERLAHEVWRSANGAGFPFNCGLGCERIIRPEEITVLRKLFMHKVDWVKDQDSPEEFEEVIKDDRTFLELAGIGTRWDTDGIISLLFDLAQIADPTIKYKWIQNAGNISLY